MVLFIKDSCTVTSLNQYQEMSPVITLVLITFKEEFKSRFVKTVKTEGSSEWKYKEEESEMKTSHKKGTLLEYKNKWAGRGDGHR